VSGHNFGIAGIVFIANDATNNNSGNNIVVYNNTMVNIQGSYSGVVVQKGTGIEVRNNIWYGSVRTNNSFSGTMSHNWYYNTAQDGDATATKVVCTSGCDIFNSISGKDFRLKTATAAAMALAAPYNVDGNGVTRGLDGHPDRGAYEYAAPGSAAVSAPSNLRVE
jgi:hypothetical protein